MNFIRSYFSYAYHFMVDADIRYGEEFHFVPFFLLSVLLPVNVFLFALLPAEHFMVLYAIEIGGAFALGFIFSLFPGFKRMLRYIFDSHDYRKKKLKFSAYFKGYLLIAGVVISPCLLAVLRMAFLA